MTPEPDNIFRFRILAFEQDKERRERIKVAGPYWLDQYGALHGLVRGSPFTRELTS
jgi:hypothetical protein